jgi:hypothetical protein
MASNCLLLLVGSYLFISVNGLEAVADAIMAFEGWRPMTFSYRNRNPGNLRGGEVVDKSGYNMYPSFVDGYVALLNDLQAKFSGRNTHNLDQKSTLLQLMQVYAPSSAGNPTTDYATFVANWLTKVFGRSITVDSKLEEIWLCPAS